MLLSGDLDVLAGIPPAEARRVARDSGLRLIRFPAHTYVAVVWNTRRPLFDSREERTALTLGTDRAAMVEALLHGFGAPASTHSDPASWTYEPDVETLPHDPVRARSLLERAGWRDADGDGVLDRGGRRFEFDRETAAGSTLGEDTAILMQSQLAGLGVAVRPVIREWSTLIADVQAGDFDALLTAWSPDLVYNPRDQFHTDAIGSQSNWGAFSHPRVDSLIDLGLSLPDRADARPVWGAFQRLLALEQPYT